MLVKRNGKNYNIPDEEINTAVKKLDLTKEEAIQMWFEDNEIEINAEQAELTEKAIKTGVQKEMTRCKSNKKPTEKRERKADPTKEEVIKNLAGYLETIVQNVKVENIGKIITFTIGEEHFTLNLTRNRQKKAGKP